MARSHRPIVSWLLLFFVALGLITAWQHRDKLFSRVESTPTAGGPGEYLFCVWNVENLFDDKLDGRHKPDDEYDTWFAEVPADRELKYEHLSEALLRLNGGNGPDILAIVEVESERAAELLRDELNKGLPAGTAPYAVHMKEVAAGRHIAPAVLTRLKVTKTKGFGTTRLLHVNIEVNGHELTVLATHWTSHRTDEGAGGKRDRYADKCYGAANEVFHANPRADILLCGDFNDTPDAKEVVENLHAGADRGQVANSQDRLRFLDLLAGKDPHQFGTHFYSNKPLIYDHICVSPGLLDNVGWSCDPDSVQTVTDGLIRPGSSKRVPWRFGSRKDAGHHGYSDHFPVTVKLKVNEP